MSENVCYHEGKKYMWDGENYESKEAALENKSKYEADGFETQLVEEEGIAYVFTRRVVTEIVVEGTPPA